MELEILQGLRDSINELAEQAVADGNEQWLATACEILRDGGAQIIVDELPVPEGW